MAIPVMSKEDTFMSNKAYIETMLASLALPEATEIYQTDGAGWEVSWEASLDERDELARTVRCRFLGVRRNLKLYTSRCGGRGMIYIYLD
jgi:hypothetical protein